jgi:YQGE family putative transporter
MQVIDAVAAIERRNKFAYIFNQEFGFYVGRFSGCVLFIVLARYVSDVFALRYALLIIGVVQLLSGWMAKHVLEGCTQIAAKARVQPLGVTAPAVAAL